MPAPSAAARHRDGVHQNAYAASSINAVISASSDSESTTASLIHK